MDNLNSDSTLSEQLQAFEFDVVQFIMRAAKSGQYTKLSDLQAQLKTQFPECTEGFLGQCVEKVGESLR